MTRKKAILAGWTVLFVVSAAVASVECSGLSQENKNIIISIVFFTAVILVDCMPWPFSWIYKKTKIGKTKTP